VYSYECLSLSLSLYVQTEWDRVVHLMMDSFPDPYSPHDMVTDMLQLVKVGPVGQVWT
jgi:hypothetical protein